MKDLHSLPKVRDSWSFLYVERCRIDQEDKAIAIQNEKGKTPVPCATLTTLMLGPGTTVTHAAVKALADNGCLLIWSGEENVRFYAQGMGETRSSANLLYQARLWADPDQHLEVVRRLYEMRFGEDLPRSLTLRQIRGKEGLRVRRAYEEASRVTGVSWTGRSYKRGDWRKADPINRALSAANSCLYGICHAAIVSAGFSPALGFIHTGKMLSFVYDIADLYKTTITMPVAFRAAVQDSTGIEGRVRSECRDAFRENRLLTRIIPDIQRALGIRDIGGERDDAFDGQDVEVGELWDMRFASVSGGVNYGDGIEGADGGNEEV